MRPRAEGFTLLEVLVAMAVLTVGLTSAIYLFASAARLQTETATTQKVCALADSVFAELDTRLSPEADLAALAVKKKTHPDYPRFKYSIHIIPLDAAEYELFVVVEVFWRRHGEEKRRKFHTIMFRHLSYRDAYKGAAPSRNEGR